VVRRRSGGGAILHDHELTYSLAIPSSSRWSDENAELYDLVHQVVIQLLGRDGIESQLYKNVALADVQGSWKCSTTFEAFSFAAWKLVA